MSGVLVQFVGKIRMCDLDVHRLLVREASGFFDTRNEVSCYFTAKEADMVLEVFYYGATCRFVGEWFHEYQKFLITKIELLDAMEQPPKTKEKKDYSVLKYTKR
jgi:hypothetical protein